MSQILAGIQVSEELHKDCDKEALIQIYGSTIYRRITEAIQQRQKKEKEIDL